MMDPDRMKNEKNIFNAKKNTYFEFLVSDNCIDVDIYQIKIQKWLIM